MPAFPADPLFYLVGFTASFLMAFGKGAFGGGLAILGIPLLALVMDPIEAAIVTAVLVAAMDWVALGSFPKQSFSRPDLTWLIPGLLTGCLIGFLMFEWVDRRIVALIISLIALSFTAHFFLNRSKPGPTIPVSPVFGVAAGTAAGFTTFVAHAGGPPLALYLLRRGLDKTAYAATSVVVFTVGNLVKLPGYVYSGLDEPQVFWKALILFAAVPPGVWVGRRVLDRLPRATIFTLCYVLVGLGSAKLFYDAVKALLV